jgi:hypothetical protein
MPESYSGAIGNQTTQKQSLAHASAANIKRLAEVLERITNVGDRIFGSKPRPANPPSTTPDVVPTIQRSIEQFGALISQCEHELSELESRL